MAELGNSVIRGSLRVINGIKGDLEGSATKIKATAGAGKYYLVGTLGQSSTTANAVAYENASVYVNGSTLYASSFSGAASASNLTSGNLPMDRIPDGGIPWAKLANNATSNAQVYYNGSTFYIQGNLNVTGTTTLTNENNLAVHDAMIEVSARSSYTTAITKPTGIYVRAWNGASSSGFIGIAPATVMAAKHSAYATAYPVFMNDVTYDSATNDITYASSGIKEILSDLNMVADNDTSTITADSDSSGYYIVRKDSKGKLYVGSIGWKSHTNNAALYVASASASSTNAAAVNPYVNLYEDDFRSSFRILGSGAASANSDASKNITVQSTDYHVKTDADESGKFYLNGSASATTALTSLTGSTLKSSAKVYVSAAKLYSESDVITDALAAFTSGGAISLKSNVKCGSNPTTYVDNSTGYVYELGHRPFPEVLVDSTIF